MDAAQNWWLHNTSAGRRLLVRMLPPSAIPLPVRRQICGEQGHDRLADGTCMRCGDRPRPA